MGQVLVVEDDERIARLISRALGQQGHAVCRATNGADGLQAALDCHFDVLLLDRAGQACSRPELLADVWGLSFDPGSNVVDVCVRRLRAKLGAVARIETVRNVGYRLLAD
ncbi:DNA-binding response regulator [Dactylosporangium sp. NPDC049140]|uniref:winged helix-turn-helix transcriptional regulator n=1 Tax=Dactylosporangium sp. NPDC049140 TaxID=3155647 RepID=UPI00340DAAFB